MPADLVILDACVLIDFLSTDRSLLRLAGKVFTLHVASVVLAEVDGADEATLLALGVRVVEPSLDLSADAAGRGGALSFEDWASLLLASERGWACVTNDRRLRRECATCGVEALWGLEILGTLVAQRLLPVEAAVAAATTMHDGNPRGISAVVLATFCAKVRG